VIEDNEVILIEIPDEEQEEEEEGSFEDKRA
jgi:hypothetical protein